MSERQESSVTPLRRRGKCPECGRLSSRQSFPFCSQRCKDIDLNRWLSGSYVIPGEPLDGQKDDEDRG